MKFKLDYPFIVSLNQMEELPLFRDGEDGIRSKSIAQKWHEFENATMNGSLQEHHLYFIVSRERTRFSGLKEPQNKHFHYCQSTRRSPVEINFQSLTDEQTVMNGSFDLSDPSMAATLLDSFDGRLKIENLLHIDGEPYNQQYVSAARFRFQGEDICVPLSPDLWKFVHFPFEMPADVPDRKLPFDYRIEYIGISINYAEKRMDSHQHIRRIHTELASRSPNRESFAIMYQVDFERDSGGFGYGSRDNQLELEAAEAMLIQHFKPRYNVRSIDFSLTAKNADIRDEGLATQMRNSGDYPVGTTEILLISPAESESRFNLSWGRFFTDHHNELYKINCFNF